MAMKLSQHDLKKAAERAQSLSARLSGIKRRTEKVTERAVHSVEIAASAFAMGVIDGRTNGSSIMGVPLGLGLGLSLNLAGYLGLAGPRMSEHLHGFGDGFLAAYLAQLGYKTGHEMRPEVIAAKAAAASRDSTLGTPDQSVYPGLDAPQVPAEGGGTGYLENASVRRVGRGAAGFTDAELASTVTAAVTAAEQPVQRDE